MEQKRETVKEILMRRDRMEEEVANERIEAFLEELDYLIEKGNLEEAEELLQDYFGLEPDYLMEFL